MSTQSIPTSPNPEILIQQVLGSLLIKGSDEPQVVIQADSDELTVEKQEDSLQLSCQGDCNIRLPHGATIKIVAAHGDAHLKYLEETLIIGTIHGSLTLRSVAGTQIDTVHGDFSAKEVDGSLQVRSIYGNAAAREVLGDCILQDVQGNLDLREIEGQVTTNCSGNIRMRLDPLSGKKYHVKAEGNLYCHLPQDASVKLVMNGESDIIKVKSPKSAQVYHQSDLTLDLGDASAEMLLSAGGGLYVSYDEDSSGEGHNGETVYPEGLSQQIAQQVEAQISSQLQMINEQIERISDQFDRVGMSTEEANRILEKARQASERGTARAQEKLRLAQEKLERKLEATRRQQERRARAAEERAKVHSKRSWGMEWPASPTPPPPPSAPQVSEEERLMILRMLEQKKISLEEADKLLSALESKE